MPLLSTADLWRIAAPHCVKYLGSQLCRILDSDTGVTCLRTLNSLMLSIPVVAGATILMQHSRRMLQTIRGRTKTSWRFQVFPMPPHRFSQTHIRIGFFLRSSLLSIVLPSVRLFFDICFCLALAQTSPPLLFYWQGEDSKLFAVNFLKIYKVVAADLLTAAETKCIIAPCRMESDFVEQFTLRDIDRFDR